MCLLLAAYLLHLYLYMGIYVPYISLNNLLQVTKRHSIALSIKKLKDPQIGKRWIIGVR
jgi:Na+-translocating ferredoxin:NAD+ oxidoreductase RnfE subunit